MAHDVIMPALGMAQDTGLLVAWRKAPGDAVAAGDALFEVETDKATMEVEAAVAGYLSAVTASDGEDVPVGQVITRIVATPAEVDRTPPQGRAAVAAPALIPPPPVAAQPASEADGDSALIEALTRLSPAKAASEVAKRLGLDRRTLYDRAMALPRA